jgi:TPR repeat protein
MSQIEKIAARCFLLLIGTVTLPFSLFAATSDELLNRGIDYIQGRGVSKNVPQGIKALEAASDQGNVKSQKLLGVIYSSGEIVTTNETQAAKYFKLAAESGDALAQSTYGSCLLEGSGVKKDPSQAVTWFMKSAMQGNCDGLVNLGKCYGMGDGVERNIIEAYKYFGVAAQLGDKEATAMLPIIKEKMTPGQLMLAEKDVAKLIQEIKK